MQEADDQVAAFSEFLCEEVYGTVSCDDLSYVVSTFDDFASISFEPMFDEDGNPIPPEFDAGSAGDIVVVRVSYKWNLFTPFLSSMYGRSSFELVSTAVFRSEPYDGPI